MTDSRHLPSWIVRPNGDREPFDAEAIFRSLFQATGRIGAADAFRARELADAVLHFLAESDPGESVGLDTLTDTAVKVVRELGHESLARELAETLDSQSTVADAATDDYPTEIIAAERSGLLSLGHSDHQPVLAGSIVVPRLPGERDQQGILGALEEARGHTGGYVAIDSPEYLFRTMPSPGAIRDWIAEVREGLRRTGLRAIVNLNCRTPPSWAVAPVGGLFPPQMQAELAATRAQASQSLLDELAVSGPGRIRIDWHLCDADFEPVERPRIMQVGRHILDRVPIAFVPDRPRRVIALAEGLDRENPAVFSVVGLRGDGLARYLAQSAAGQQGALLRAIPALASLARSAGKARLRYLRGHDGRGVANGFLPDRGRLLIVPLGLRSAVRIGMAYVTDESEAEQQLLRAVLGGVSRFPSLGPPTVLDSAPPGSGLAATDQAVEQVGDATPQQQMRHAARLQADTQTGTASILLPVGIGADAGDLAGLIEYAYRLPGLVRFRFVRPGADSPTPATG